MKRKRERKTVGEEEKRNENSALFFGTVLLHFEGGKESFLLQFLEEEKAEIFELEILEVLLPLKGSKVLPICGEKLELFAANLCRKIGAICAEKLELFVQEKLELFAQKNWSCLLPIFAKKLDSIVLPI
ncbi:PREDICTED: uncharacterized protein LOC108660574 isoform X2 [Theobroma cacao]|uniref:Uncharacterized protein LOC108660574 isoform X2 n=1 Tax=Theobroma cacao TaxID=3641 RepID=A0AB32VVX5_THECC|nr:PREDICTED: uncharacterized protein LOC108660574 isoform X2 [Theobroma cacao]